MNTEMFNSPEYIRSRRAYVVQCTVEYFVSLLVTDAFLASLLSSVGISDSMIGIISSFITLAFVVQILTLFMTKIKVGAKKIVMTLDTASIFFFMLIFLVPVLPMGKTAKTALIIAGILLAYFCKYLILNICFNWANGYVEPTKRARFSASKEMISLFSGMIFTAATGYIVDKFEMSGNINGGFLFIAVSIFILNVCNFVSLALIRRDCPADSVEKNEPFSEVLKNTVGNKNFRSIIVLNVLWYTAIYFTTGFLGIFKYKDLMMSVFLVQLVNIAANLVRLLVSKPFGRYSDKYTYAKGFKLGLCFAGAAFFINMFTTKSTWFLIVIYTVLYNVSIAGINQNSFNIVYSYVDSRYIVQAMAIKNCISGLMGFGASVLGGRILGMVQANDNTAFGVHIYGQQILSAISFVIILIAIVYTRKVVEKQKVLVQ